MRNGSAIVLLLMVGVSGLIGAQDLYCPAYPMSVRAADREALRVDEQYWGYVATSDSAALPPAKNIIDQWIFKKLSGDAVDAAPLTTDLEFVRRAYLDLTGRIPSFEQAQAFLNDSNPNKRATLIDAL